MTTSQDLPIEAKGRQGQVSFDGEFVTISRKGFLARATVGKGDKRIPIRSITSVQWKSAGAIMNGFIQFSMGGGNERRSSFGSQTSSAGSDENSVLFTKVQQPEFETLREAIEAGIVAGHAPASAIQVQPDSLDQLKKLGDLRDAGILNDEEFAAKKAQILGT